MAALYEAHHEDGKPLFMGHEPRECGEHRTVGAHRAWCYECSEWCYPREDASCKGCNLPPLREQLARAAAERQRFRLAWMSARRRAIAARPQSRRAKLDALAREFFDERYLNPPGAR